MKELYINDTEINETDRFMAVPLYTLKEAHEKFKKDSYFRLTGTRGVSVDAIGYLEQITEKDIEFIEVDKEKMFSINF